MTPLPPEEIAQFMRFLAKKAKNVKYPMNVMELCRQFKEETGSLVSAGGLKQRIDTHQHRIHSMEEFDMVTKVKMLFALSAPINKGFLNELKKVADVEVDDQQRIIHYKQKNGTLELSAKYLQLSAGQSEQRNREIIQFLVKKSETVDTPIPDRSFLEEFKEKTGCSATMNSLKRRYNRLKNKIFQLTEISKNTRIKMMFISNVKLSEDILKELRKDAYVEVDVEGGITRYKANDGRLELEESHGMSSIMNSFHSNSWKVKMMFALSTPVDAKFLEEIQKDAFVELDELRRIKTYIANDGSLELEGDHSLSAKVNVSSGSTGEKYSQSTRLPQNIAAIQKGRKRARQISEKDNDGEPLKVEEDSATDFDTNHVVNRRYNYCDLDPQGYEEDMDPISKDKKPENLTEVKTEEPDGPSTSNLEYNFEENLDHILIDPKPEII